MAERLVNLSGLLPDGETGYALHQVGCDIPLSFFWYAHEDKRHEKWLD